MLGDPLLGECHNALASILIVRQSAFDKFVDDDKLGLGSEQVGIMPGGRSVCATFLHRHPPHVAPHLAPFSASGTCGGIYGLDRPDDGLDAIPSKRDAITRPGTTICDISYNADAPHLMSPAIIQFDGYIGSRFRVGAVAIRAETDLHQTSGNALVVIEPIRLG